MNIIFEKTSGTTPGAQPQSRSHHGADTRAGSIIPFPSGSIHAAGPAFKRGNALQAFIDCLAVITVALLVTVTGIGFAFAFFVLLFVNTTG